MPDPLKKRIDKPLSGKETIYVSRGDALRQLPSGSVKLPFSEIVRQMPNTFLPPDAEMLNTMVTLPLQEILPHIKTLPRRAAQRQIDVPQDLAPVFGTGTEQSREVRAPDQPVRTGSRPSPPPPPDESMVIPPPAPRPIPPPAARPLPPGEPRPIAKPQPPGVRVVMPTPTAPAEASAPPPAAPIKPLEPQSPIKMAPISMPAPEAPKPAPAPAATPAPTPAPAPVAMPSAPKPLVAQPAAPVPVAAPSAAEPSLGFGDVFGQPEKKDWTPQEIVEKTSSLRGVAGALITTVDGLPVAFQLPSNLNGNAVAAFIPQMYTRITQYTRDLKLGDAKHLTILVENVPLQIFKSGSVYFTALGKANENLPKPQLTAIAAALGRPSQT
jgi:predicted regulator of Ras-like GTPase activity (Roadblock/LC7/MglB family)